MRHSHCERRVCKPQDIDKVKRGYQCTVRVLKIILGLIGRVVVRVRVLELIGRVVVRILEL